MRQKATSYSEEFKKNALHRLAISGKKKSEIEDELGIRRGTLHKWQLRYQINPESNELEKSEIEQLKAELRKLQRENSILREEREILKKTVTIFSTDPSK